MLPSYIGKHEKINVCETSQIKSYELHFNVQLLHVLNTYAIGRIGIVGVVYYAESNLHG